MRNGQRQPVLLVASGSTADANLVVSLLSSDFEKITTSTIPDRALQDFKDTRPDVLVLAFDTIEKAHVYYLGLYRFSGLEPLHPHRTVLLCHQNEINNAYRLCADGYIDDYVLFWPIPHDARRLPMAVLHAWRDLASKLDEGETASKLIGSARQLSGFPPMLDAQIAQGAKHIEHISRNVQPRSGGPSGELSTSVQAASQWVSGLQSECSPYLDAIRSLEEITKGISPSVLIVEDEKEERELIAKLLDDEPFHVTFAKGGVEALHVLRKLRPDVILMDLLMPDFGGIQVLQCLKGAPELSHVPVIIMTGKSERDIVMQCRNAGAAALIVKPLKRETLVSKLSQVLVAGSGRFQT